MKMVSLSTDTVRSEGTVNAPPSSALSNTTARLIELATTLLTVLDKEAEFKLFNLMMKINYLLNV